MNKNIQSHNTELSLTARSSLIPSWLQLVLYLFISLLILLALNFQNLWDYLNEVVLVDGSGSGLQAWLSGSTQTRVLQFVFWLFIGCTVYVFIWFMNNIITNIRNDVVAGEYIHPNPYSRTKYWESILGRKLFFVGSLLTLAGFIFAAYKLASVLANLAQDTIKDFSLSPGIQELLGAMLGTAILLYLAVLLSHITINSWRAIYYDL